MFQQENAEISQQIAVDISQGLAFPCFSVPKKLLIIMGWWISKKKSFHPMVASSNHRSRGSASEVRVEGVSGVQNDTESLGVGQRGMAQEALLSKTEKPFVGVLTFFSHIPRTPRRSTFSPQNRQFSHKPNIAPSRQFSKLKKPLPGSGLSRFSAFPNG